MMLSGRARIDLKFSPSGPGARFLVVLSTCFTSSGWNGVMSESVGSRLPSRIVSQCVRLSCWLSMYRSMLSMCRRICGNGVGGKVVGNPLAIGVKPRRSTRLASKPRVDYSKFF